MNSERVKRLEALADARGISSGEAYAALKRRGACPRFALVSAEDAYPDNGFLTVHETVEEVAVTATRDANDMDPYTPQKIVDLDTGDELTWSLKVEVEVPAT